MMVMTSTSRKQKPSYLDGDSCPSKEAREEMLVLRRSSRKALQSPARKNTARHTDKENYSSPHRLAAGSSSKSPCKSPLKPSVISISFYGKQKTGYLTPLERKALKESLPPLLPSFLAKKSEKKRAKRSIKPQKLAVRSTKLKKMGITINTSTKRIRLPSLNSSVGNPGSSPASPPTSSNSAQAKKQFNFSFNTMKPKPKICVGAAFFSTGTKPKLAYKKSAPKSSSRPFSVPVKSNKPQVTLKRKQQQKESEKAFDPGCFLQRVAQPVQRKEKKLSAEFDSANGWMACDREQLETPKPLSSPKTLVEKYGITRDLKIVLLRTPTTSPVQSFLAQVSCGSVPDLSEFCPTSPVSNSPKEASAVYPIFNSASKRMKWAAPQFMSADTSSTTLKEPSARRKTEKQDDDQLIIDAGQRQFGAMSCSSCGMVYSADNPEDTFQHTLFHQRLFKSIRYVGWKKERLVAEFWDGKIILVTPNDSKYAIKKAEDVRRVVDNELGFQQVTLGNVSQAKTYLFINTEQMVVGCLVAEPIRLAYRVLEQPDHHRDMKREDFLEPQRAWCCSTVPEPALCGISRIWVFSQARRQGIATRMLNALRYSFFYGSHLTKEEIAFSDPTPDGKQFASKYCDTATFLVYNSV